MGQVKAMFSLWFHRLLPSELAVLFVAIIDVVVVIIAAQGTKSNCFPMQVVRMTMYSQRTLSNVSGG
eukprot:4606295-Lingulodinium_polyedra.AAC.1